MSPTSYQTAPPRAVVEPGVYEAHRASASGRGWADGLLVSKAARELDEGYGEQQADDHEGDQIGILEELSRTLSHSNLLRLEVVADEAVGSRRLSTGPRLSSRTCHGYLAMLRCPP